MFTKVGQIYVCSKQLVPKQSPNRPCLHASCNMVVKKYLCSSAYACPSNSTSGSEDYLLQVGISNSAIEKAKQKFPDLPCVDVAKRLQPNILLLRSTGLSMEDIQSIIVRCPSVVSLDVDAKVMPVIQFLEELGLDNPSICSVIKRFPLVLTYGVKSHLRPHVAYLKSLGVDGNLLPSLVVERPAILGSGIEQLVNHLLRSGFQRKQVGNVLRTYPFLYRIPVFSTTTSLADLD